MNSSNQAIYVALRISALLLAIIGATAVALYAWGISIGDGGLLMAVGMIGGAAFLYGFSGLLRIYLRRRRSRRYYRHAAEHGPLPVYRIPTLPKRGWW